MQIFCGGRAFDLTKHMNGQLAYSLVLQVKMSLDNLPKKNTYRYICYLNVATSYQNTLIDKFVIILYCDITYTTNVDHVLFI